MSVWLESIARRWRAWRLDSMRTSILVFAALAGVIPAVATTCVSYRQSRRSLDARLDAELRAASADAARELGVWLDTRLNELRTSARSYVIPDNLARIPGRESAQALSRLRAYLNSARERFPNQDALFVVDERGRVIASSSGRVGSVRLSADRLSDLRAGDAFVSDAYWDPVLEKAAIVLAVPIREADGRFLAAFAAKVGLTSVEEILERRAARTPRAHFVMTDEGRLVITARESSADLMRTSLPEATSSDLLDMEGQTVAYRRPEGSEVTGAARRVPGLRWAAVAELPRAEVGRQVGRLRSRAAVLLVTVLAVVAALAYTLGWLVARPIERLAAVAAKVTAGDLSVELPAAGRGEVGYVTRAFAHLVTRLREREGQGELERLSVTDALTGLYNRRHLVGTLANEVQRSRRLRRTFSVLLADVDHFKQYNDTHGHLAGDAALVKVAEILRKMTRGVDSVARYGGEEFLVMLLEAPLTVAITVGERIRARVAGEAFEGGRMTLSIGVAEYPTHGDTPEELIESADAALYEAKRTGRDRVVAAGGAQERGREPDEKRPKPRRRKGEA